MQKKHIQRHKGNEGARACATVEAAADDAAETVERLLTQLGESRAIRGAHEPLGHENGMRWISPGAELRLTA